MAEKKEHTGEVVAKVEEEEDYSSPTACEALKKRHDKCFFAWYHDEFIQGKATEMKCQTEWEQYEQCLKKKLAAFDLSYLKDGEGK